MNTNDTYQKLMPRDKALRYGISKLSDKELLALFLGSGQRNKSVFEIATEVIKTFKNFSNMKNATINELKEIEGIGKAKSIELQAIFEIAKRSTPPKSHDFSSKLKIIEYAQGIIGSSKQEKLMVLIFDQSHNILFEKIIYKGSAHGLNISVKEILSLVLKHDGSQYYLFHNHPSGNSYPSTEDKELTERLIYYSNLFNIIFISHIIVTKSKDYSIVE